MIRHNNNSMQLSVAAQKMGFSTVKLIERLIHRNIQIYVLPKEPEFDNFVGEPILVDLKKLKNCLDSKNYIYNYKSIIPDDPRAPKYGFEYKFSDSVEELMISQIEFSKIEGEFKHSPDYASVELHGKSYKLSKNKRFVIKILHEAYKKGLDSLSQIDIAERINCPGSRLIDIFRNHEETFSELVRKTAPGYFSINLD